MHSEPAGKCPECGADVMETEKAFGCSRWREGVFYHLEKRLFHSFSGEKGHLRNGKNPSGTWKSRVSGVRQ